MISSDFSKYNIKNFTPEEIESTGAKLEDVQLETIFKLQYFRNKIKRTIVLLNNGLTSGNHSSKKHPEGLAVDFTFREGDGTISVTEVFKYALEAKFKGIGIYHNQATYSFHFDLRECYGFWSARKEHRATSWEYDSLIVDPKNFF